MTMHISVVQIPQRSIDKTVSIQIRRGSPRDRHVVCRLEMACFGRARLLFGLWWLIGKPTTELWVAEDCGNLIGYVILYANELDGKMLPYIGGVGVTLERRKAGIGAQLMTPILAQHAKLWLHVRASNVAAIRLYEKLDMSELRRMPKFYSNGEDALILATRAMQVESEK